MGLFSHKERIPPPQTSIILDQSGSFVPGSQLSGNATIQTQIPRSIQSATVVCIGKATTHNIRRVQRAGSAGRAGPGNGRRTIHYHDEATLFHLNQGLFTNTQSTPEQPLSCPFSFTLPWNSPDVHGMPYTEGYTNPEAYASTSHPLPPTFSHFRDEYHYATVEYGLQLVIHFGDEGNEPWISPLEQIVFCPPNAGNESQLLETIMPTEKYASSRLTGAEKSTFGSMKDRFSSSTPSVDVVLKARISSMLATGAEFTIQTCLEIDSFSDANIMSIPSADLRIRDIKLLPITFFRALRAESWSSSSFDRGEHEEVDEEKVLLNVAPPSQTIQQQVIGSDKGGDVKWVYPATFSARIPGDTCPSFRTFNINRTYRLKMVLEAEVVGKVFEHKFEMNVVVGGA